MQSHKMEKHKYLEFRDTASIQVALETFQKYSEDQDGELEISDLVIDGDKHTVFIPDYIFYQT